MPWNWTQRRAPAHRDAQAGPAQIDARACDELLSSRKLVCHVRRQNGHIERAASFNTALEIGSKRVFDHELVAGHAFENRSDLSQNGAGRGATEHPRLDRLRNGRARQSQCGKDRSHRCDRRCHSNLRPHPGRLSDAKPHAALIAGRR
jgi:hypothetical protein